MDRVLILFICTYISLSSVPNFCFWALYPPLNLYPLVSSLPVFHLSLYLKTGHWHGLKTAQMYGDPKHRQPPPVRAHGGRRVCWWNYQWGRAERAEGLNGGQDAVIVAKMMTDRESEGTLMWRLRWGDELCLHRWPLSSMTSFSLLLSQHEV